MLAVVLVLCLGGAAITWLVAKDAGGRVVAATKTRVVAPPPSAGRPKVTDPQLQSAATQMKVSLSEGRARTRRAPPAPSTATRTSRTWS